MPMKEVKKGLKVLGALMRLGQQQRVASPQVQAAEDGAPRVLTADGYGRGLAPAGPSRPQRWQQQQLGFVLNQEHGARGQGPNLAADPAFFSLAAAPGSVRNGSASTHSRARAGAVGSCPLRGRAGACPGPTPAAAAKRSNPWPSNQSRWATGPAPRRGEAFLKPFIPTQRTALAGLVAQPFQAAVGAVAFEPTVEAARGDAQLAGYLLEGSIRIEFQQG